MNTIYGTRDAPVAGNEWLGRSNGSEAEPPRSMRWRSRLCTSPVKDLRLQAGAEAMPGSCREKILRHTVKFNSMSIGLLIGQC